MRQAGVAMPYRAAAVVLGGLVIAAAVAVSLWQFVFASPAAPTPGLRLSYPGAWAQVSPGTLNGAPQDAVAALLRKDKRAVLIVARTVATPITAATATTLERRLAARYSDFKLLRQALIRVAAGKALFVSYERTKQGKGGELHTVTVIPAGRVSYLLESASPFGDARIDHELERIISLARLVPKK